MKVATTSDVSELMPVVGETPVKTHPLSLARARSAMREGKEAYFIYKIGCIIQKIDLLFW